MMAVLAQLRMAALPKAGAAEFCEELPAEGLFESLLAPESGEETAETPDALTPAMTLDVPAQPAAIPVPLEALRTAPGNPELTDATTPVRPEPRQAATVATTPPPPPTDAAAADILPLLDAQRAVAVTCRPVAPPALHPVPATAAAPVPVPATAPAEVPAAAHPVLEAPAERRAERAAPAIAAAAAKSPEPSLPVRAVPETPAGAAAEPARQPAQSSPAVQAPPVLQPQSPPQVQPQQPSPAQLQVAPAAEAQPSLAERLMETKLDLAKGGEWLDRLARDIARSAANDGMMRFRLNPERLGTLQVELTQGPNGTAIRLTAETEAARAIIAEAQPRLVAEARAQGVRIAETHVDLGSGGGTGAEADAQRQRRGPAGDDARGLLRTAAGGGESESVSDRPRRRSSERYA
ncbi:MAG: flagellar hook-length control protein FliK [Allosphingosinicella sp.]|uniref:flagellar hook-length control protein FliK n=1 Tax=Allosphingosinicella sp. TaxID=2823234 RepID=UPI00394C5BAD